MDEFQEKILKFITENSLIRKGETVVVGVSGGVDSVALLHILNNISSILDFKIIVAHFNHCLRGEESDQDERFVSELASKLKLPFKSASGDVHLLMNKERYSLEMAARKLRHEFLAKIARDSDSKKIALAHHSDDQIELFFLRLLRGAGPSGLRGMKPSGPSPVSQDITIIRPLLKSSKKEIEQYAHANYIDYRTDSTNQTLYFLRNKIRNELIPLLKLEYQHSIEKVIVREIEILDAEDDFIKQQAEKWLLQKDVPFKDLHVALQRKIIQIQLNALGVEPEFHLIDKLRTNLNTQISADNDLIIIINNEGVIKLSEHSPDIFLPNQKTIILDGDKGCIMFDAVIINWEIISLCSNQHTPQNDLVYNLIKGKTVNTEYFDHEKIGREILLRHWQEGDRFMPIGMKEKTKLQDLFTNLKIPRLSRHELIVAQTKDGEIFWVEGIRISEEFKITTASKSVLKWEVLRQKKS